MSGWPRCASVAPSYRFASAWTIDCGCTTTSIRSYGVPNSQCASITSRPLFISVAESIVILPPIAQVGCASACSTVTSSSSARARPRNGPPEAVMVRRSTVPGRSPSISWCSAECSESTGMSCAPVASQSAITSSPPTTSDSLLASATSIALGERDDRGPEAGGADDRVEHEVGAGLGDEPHEPLRARRAPRRPSTPRPRARRRRGRSARSGPRRGRAPARSAPRASARPRGRRARTRPGARDTTSSACTPIEPVEPRIRSRFIRRPSVARGSYGSAKA